MPITPRRLAAPVAALLAFLIAAWLGPASAEPAPAADHPEPTPAKAYTLIDQRPDRWIAQLPNRMVLVAQEVPTAPVVSVQLWVKTGSVYEQEHVGAGLSHFLEHLLAGGSTTTRTEAESNAILGRIGAQVNAATSLDYVFYYINTTAEHTAAAVDLISDWLQNNTIDPAEYQRERSVIQREFEMGQGDPGRIFWKLTQQARYVAHPAKHPTIGYLDEFLTVSREEIEDFYRRMYVPNNMILVVAGDIDKAAVIEQAAGLWGDRPAGDLPSLTLPVEAGSSGSAEAQGYADIERPRLRLFWPGKRLAAEGDYELDLLAVILGQGESSRLVRQVRDERRLVNTIDAYNASYAWGEGFFGVDLELAEGQDEAEARAAVMDEIARLRSEPVSAEELARAKRKILASVVAANQTAQGIAQRLARDLIATGDPNYLPRYAQAIQSITADELLAEAKKTLQPEQLTVVKLLPAGDDQAVTSMTRPEADPRGESLPRAAVKLDNRHLVEEMHAALAETDDAASALVVDEPVMRRLDNGLRVIVQRSTVVPAVAMQMYRLGGLLAEPAGKAGIASAAASMRMRGTADYDADALAEALEDLGADMTTGSGNNTAYTQAFALSADWPRVMELMGRVVLEPTFPQDEWEKLRPRLLAAIDREQDRWSGELRRSFRAAYFGGHPWAHSSLGEREAVAALGAEELAAYHRSRLGAADTVLAVVGDVDVEAVFDQAQAVFGAMPASAPEPFEARAAAAPEPRVLLEPTRKPVTAVQIGFGPAVERSHPDYAELQVLSRLMSDFPSGWLEQELRGRGPGLVYSVGAGVMTGVVPGYFAVLFNTGADSVAEAVSRSMAVVQRAKEGPIDDAELARAKAKVLTAEFFGKQDNASRATEAALDELYDVNDPGAKRFIAEVQAVDAAALRRVARAYLVNPVAVVLSDQPVPVESLEPVVLGGEAPDAEAAAPAGPATLAD